MNISELTMQAIKDERRTVEAKAKKLLELSSLSFDIPGIDSSTISASGLLIFCHGNDWKPAYRALRQASGQRPNRISIFPNRLPSMEASVNLEFHIGKTHVTLNFYTQDYQKFIKPGANCRRESISDQIVCA